MQVDTSLEAAVVGWVATRSADGGLGEPKGQPLVEVLAEDLGLDANPATLDALAATLLGLERDERIVLDGPVATATDLAPLDLATGGGPSVGVDRPAPSARIATYSKLSSAPRHVQLNWALRALRAGTDPGGSGEFDFRSTIAALELNPKDVRHPLEALGHLRKEAGASGAEAWWVDPGATVTAADLDELGRQERIPPPPPEPPDPPPAESGPSAPAGSRALLADLGPVVESLTKLEPRLVDLIHQLVEAAESMHGMAGTQAQLLREQVSEIEALRQDRERLVRDAANLRQEMWNLKHRNARSPEAEELSAEASRLRAAERRFAGTASEVTDKVRRVNRGLDEAAGSAD
ncbi:MAG: hypothetical protein ABJC62_12165 [Frankiaceae bacterium]